MKLTLYPRDHVKSFYPVNYFATSRPTRRMDDGYISHRTLGFTSWILHVKYVASHGIADVFFMNNLQLLKSFPDYVDEKVHSALLL